MDIAKFSGAGDVGHEYNRTDVMRKRKRESTHQLNRDRAAHVPTTPAVSPHRYHPAETELDRLSNSVVGFVEEGHLDEADCEELRTQCPEVHDWLMRKAMACEARGETTRAIEYCERTIASMDAPPEDFDPESRAPFYRDIERQRGPLRNAR